jgi:hypothetical protein
MTEDSKKNKDENQEEVGTAFASLSLHSRTVAGYNCIGGIVVSSQVATAAAEPAH